MVGTWSATMSKLLHHEAIVCGWGSCQHVPWRETACSSYSDGTETNMQAPRGAADGDTRDRARARKTLV